MKMQRRLRAAAQHSSSELSSAFALHRSCTVIQELPVLNETHERSLTRVLTQKLDKMKKKEAIKFVAQLIAAIASAILTALGTTSCM